MIESINAEVVEWASGYTGEPFHALLTDPPYHLTTITKRFGKPNAAPAREGRDGAFRRVSRGFMGETWDGGDISFQPETWESLSRLLYPGAFGFAFGGSRTHHRIAVAIEDAGFIIHPSIFWVYASGLPKGTRIDSQIARNNGTPEFIKTWESHRYGLQALKPASEPIIVFQKPYDGRPIDNIVSSGAGAINVDAGRTQIDPEKDDPRLFGSGSFRESYRHIYSQGDPDKTRKYNGDGRYPTNVVLSHSPDCIPNDSGGVDCSLNCPVAFLGYNARYFFSADYALESLEGSSDALYYPKASTAERDSGLDSFPDLPETDGRKNPHPSIKPISLVRYLASLLLPPPEYKPRRILIPFSGSGSEMIGATLAGFEDVTGVELSPLYTDIQKARIEFHSQTSTKTATNENGNHKNKLPEQIGLPL